MAQSTEPGASYSQIMDEKRVGMLRHLIGKHSHPDNSTYKKCTHARMKNKRMDHGEHTQAV